MSASRGDVWLVNFDPIQGHEQAGYRPALVLSVDSFNSSSSGLVTVLPLTSKRRSQIPSRVEVNPPEGGLTSTSYIIGEQVRTISTSRLGRRLGVVAISTMTKVEDVVRILLGL